MNQQIEDEKKKREEKNNAHMNYGTLFASFERTFSKTPNGRATDVGIPTQEGTFPFRNAMFLDLAPT